MNRLTAALIVALCIALFAVIHLAAGPSGATWDPVCDHAGFRTNEWGTAALRDLLGRLGLRAASWERPWTELSSQVRQLWVVHPVTRVSDDEQRALLRWVRNGGTAVLAPDPRRAGRGMPQEGRAVRWSLPPELGLRSVEGPAGDSSVRPGASGALTRDVSKVAVPAQWRLKAASRTPAVVLLGDQRGAAAVLLDHGRGKVLALCDADMLSNSLIGRADNAVLAANIAFSSDDGVVWFDEYHHGRVRSGAGDLDTGVARRAIWATLLALALYAVGKLWRFGPVVPLPAPPRRSAAEYVRAFASLYRRAGHREAVLRMSLQRLHTALAARAGVRLAAPTEPLDPAALSAAADLAARRLPWLDANRLASVLSTAHTAAATGGPRTDAQLLALSREIATIEQELMGHDG